MSELRAKRCVPCEGGAAPMSATRARALLQQLDGWSLSEDEAVIERSFRFDNYYQTMAFVNALAFVAHREDHHPDLEVGYNRCRVVYTTHAIGGLSENDFICAAKIDALQAR